MAHEIPEARLIQGEVTIRDLSLPSEVKLARKSLVRWIALSAGLISPRESRKTLIDLLEVLFKLQLEEGVDPRVPGIMEEMHKLNPGHNEKAVRYHITQLFKSGVLARSKGKYFFAVAPYSEKGDVAASFENVFRQKSEVALAKMREALKALKKLHEER